MQKMPPETHGFWTSFCVQELLPKFRRSRESAFFYSRCRYIGWLKGVVLLPGESILPSGRTTSFFIWAGAAAGLLLSQFPRHLISNETLEGKGNPKTIGFWRKPPKRRLWRMKRGGFEEVSRFSRHNVAGNRLTRQCVLLPTFPAAGKSGPPGQIIFYEKAVCVSFVFPYRLFIDFGNGSSNTHGSSMPMTEIVKYVPVCSLGEAKPSVMAASKRNASSIWIVPCPTT